MFLVASPRKSMLGGYAEQVAVPAAGLRRSPAELDDAEAVSLLVNYHTMYFAFERTAADLMIAVLPPRSPGLRSVALPPVPASLVVRADHPLARGQHDERSLDAHLLLTVRGSDPRLQLSTAGIEAHSTVHLNDFASKREAILAGIGYGWLPEHLCADDHGSDPRLELPTAALERRAVFVQMMEAAVRQKNMNTVGGGMDKAFAALLEDLKEQGMLESTLVVLGSEFGRTPDINENSGRDHYPLAFTAVMAGGGVKGGFTYGSTDKDGRRVADKQATPPDFLSTIGHAMGLPVDEVVMSPSNRPFTVGDKGSVITEMFA